MSSPPRYEILDQIGQGDFAAVYRARDVELDRAVAIKQIHAQYLAEPAKCERYWREAQILASVDHPCIMKIFDLVRDRGWLVLELMQGSIKQQLDDQPMDLDHLRMVLTLSLHALAHLDKKGVVHGDIKPSNLLVDLQGSVKLGDFGIARKLSGDDGSVVKGAAKYMAPEVVSDQFGPVGPHSDLYSLGFTSYELLCGAHFETLFPGLQMFGRDQQIAWMMWQAAADRRLPPIGSVLQGVPQDLAYVIERLTTKDPARRYQTAEEVLADLKEHKTQDAGPTAEEIEQQQRQAQQAQRKRILLVAAAAVSLAMSLLMLFLPGGSSTGANLKQSSRFTHGVLHHVDVKNQRLFAQPLDGPAGVDDAVSIDVTEDDLLLLNDRRVGLGELRLGDEIEITYGGPNQIGPQSGADNSRKTIIAQRPPPQEHQGRITLIDSRSEVIAVQTGLSEGGSGKTVRMRIPLHAAVFINGKPDHNGRAFRLADLQSQDRVQVTSVDTPDGLMSQTVRVRRTVTSEVKVVQVNRENRQNTVRARLNGRGAVRTLPLAETCKVVINDRTELNNQPLTIADIQESDAATLAHDIEVTQITIRRTFVVDGVVRSVDVRAQERFGRLVVAPLGQTGQTEFRVGADCKMTADPQSAAVRLSFLQPGDRVKVSHRSLDLSDITADTIVVSRRSNPSVWAIVIHQEQFADAAIPPPENTPGAIAAVRKSLWWNYRVPTHQVLHLHNPHRDALQGSIRQHLGRAETARQIVVYYAGWTIRDPTPEGDGALYLATADFDPLNVTATSLPVSWLLEQLEAARAKEKTLFLGAELFPSGDPQDPTGPEAWSALEHASRTVLVLVGGLKPGDAKQFALATAEAFRGPPPRGADANSDYRITGAELHEYLMAKMAPKTPEGVDSPQAIAKATPILQFVPLGNVRLHPKTQAAVRKQLGFLWVRHLRDDYQQAHLAARAQISNEIGDQPDVRLAHGLVLLKHKRTAEALAVFEQLQKDKVEHPLVLLSLGWIYLETHRRNAGVDQLVRLANLPSKRPSAPNAYRGDSFLSYAMTVAGGAYGFALKAAPRPATREEMSRLLTAVQNRGDKAKQAFTQGYRQVIQEAEAIDRRLQVSREFEKRQWERRKGQFSHYVQFDYRAAESFLASGLSGP